MIWLLVATLAVVALVVWWLFKPREPLPNPLDSPDALARALEYLRNRGVEGSQIRIQAKDDHRMAVVVTKHILAPDRIELQGTVAEEAMLDGGFEVVKAALAKRGITHGEGEQNGRRTL